MNLTNCGVSLISPMMFKRFKLFIWDFDDTLINTTAYYTRDMEPMSIRKRTDIELLQDIPGVLYFRCLCNYLVSRGKRVGIASFGTYEIIQAYMDRIFGLNQKFFTLNNILTITRDCNRVPVHPIPRNKNGFIQKLMDLYKIRDYNSVILFDDKSENCADASFMGIVAIKIPGRDVNTIIGLGKFFDNSTMRLVDIELTKQCNELNLDSGRSDIVNDRLVNHLGNDRQCEGSYEDERIIITPVIEGFNDGNSIVEVDDNFILNENSKMNWKLIVMIIFLIIILALGGYYIIYK